MVAGAPEGLELGSNWSEEHLVQGLHTVRCPTSTDQLAAPGTSSEANAEEVEITSSEAKAEEGGSPEAEGQCAGGIGHVGVRVGPSTVQRTAQGSGDEQPRRPQSSVPGP